MIDEITLKDFSAELYKFNKKYYSKVGLTKEEVDEFNLFKSKVPVEVKQLYERVKKAKKRYRIKFEKISSLSDELFFCTWTFSDDYIDSAEDLIKSFRKTLSCYYIINEDHGLEHGRIHFHAITSERIDSWPYGFQNCKKIKLCDSSKFKISDYVNKLTNHALKENNKRLITYYKLK